MLTTNSGPHSCQASCLIFHLEAWSLSNQVAYTKKMCIGFMTLTDVPSKQIQLSNLNFTPVFLHHLAIIFLQFNLLENI